MSGTSLDVKKMLQQYKSDHGIYEEAEVSTEEHMALELLLESGQPLPEGVNCRRAKNPNDTDFFYRIAETKLSDMEIIEFLIINQAKTLRSIKTTVTFLLAAVIIAIILLLIAFA